MFDASPALPMILLCVLGVIAILSFIIWAIRRSSRNASSGEGDLLVVVVVETVGDVIETAVDSAFDD